jgi:hypothetical protein
MPCNSVPETVEPPVPGVTPETRLATFVDDDDGSHSLAAAGVSALPLPSRGVRHDRRTTDRPPKAP